VPLIRNNSQPRANRQSRVTVSTETSSTAAGSILRGFLGAANCDILDVGHGHPLGLQQEIPQVLIWVAANVRLSAVVLDTDTTVHNNQTAGLRVKTRVKAGLYPF
jgi:hypothetical protein